MTESVAERDGLAGWQAGTCRAVISVWSQVRRESRNLEKFLRRNRLCTFCIAAANNGEQGGSRRERASERELDRERSREIEGERSRERDRGREIESEREEILIFLFTKQWRDISRAHSALRIMKRRLIRHLGVSCCVSRDYLNIKRAPYH